jgi:nucleoside-diphosphate-sugar epimerase
MPRVVFAGCGFLGEAAALLFLRSGWDVVGVTHREESAMALRERGIASDVADLSDAESVENLASRVGDVDVVVHAASSGRGGEDAYRAVYRDGMANLVSAFPGSFSIFTGSTSVYGQLDGEVVTETSVAEPDRATGRILLEAEQRALAAGGAVARLAGIYGPGRSVLLRKFRDSTARIEGDGLRFVNQIHRDDAGAALLALATLRQAGIFNVVDDAPATQLQVYQWIADVLDQPLPPHGEPDLNRKRGWTSKRVSNLRLRSLGWVPVFPSYRDALPTLID